MRTAFVLGTLAAASLLLASLSWSEPPTENVRPSDADAESDEPPIHIPPDRGRPDDRVGRATRHSDDGPHPGDPTRGAPPPVESPTQPEEPERQD